MVSFLRGQLTNHDTPLTLPDIRSNLIRPQALRRYNHTMKTPSGKSGSRQRPSSDGTSPPQNPEILYEDNHLLVLNKPAGLPTAGVVDRPSLLEWARDDIKVRYQKPGNVFLGVVSRLDTVTSGVLVFARTSKAAGRLSDQIRRHAFDKQYLAIVRGTPLKRDGHLVDEVYKDDAAHRMRVAPRGASNRQNTSSQRGARGRAAAKTQTAELRYRVAATWELQGEPLSLLVVQLLTGRKHQIRLQFADRGLPIWGDTKYGDPARMPDGAIALHAWQLGLEHPTRREPLRFSVRPPKAWRSLLPADCHSASFWDQLATTRLPNPVSD